MAHYDFNAPVTESEVRKLEVNDTVTLNGTLYGIRDATQIHMFDRGRKTRFDLRGHAVIHTAPNVKQVPQSVEFPAGYAPLCVGTTTSAPYSGSKAQTRRSISAEETCGMSPRHTMAPSTSAGTAARPALSEVESPSA